MKLAAYVCIKPMNYKQYRVRFEVKEYTYYEHWMHEIVCSPSSLMEMNKLTKLCNNSLHNTTQLYYTIPAYNLTLPAVY